MKKISCVVAFIASSLLTLALCLLLSYYNSTEENFTVSTEVEESTELLTPEEIAQNYSEEYEPVPDVITEDWLKGHSFADVPDSDIDREDVEISSELSDDYSLQSDDLVTDNIDRGDYMLATCMNYIDAYVKEHEFEEVRIDTTSLRADGTVVMMELDGGYYEFYCLPIDTTDEGELTVYCVYRGNPDATE